jgi:magnesium-transporting ATPase (P-type)
MQVEKLSWLIIALIVLSTLMFAIGVAIERQDENKSGTEEGHDEAEELNGGGENDEETIFGMNLESTQVIITIVAVWIILVAALLLFGRPVYVIISIAALIATIFDIGEVIRKLGENNLIAFFAIIVTLSHFVIAILSGFAYLRKQ